MKKVDMLRAYDRGMLRAMFHSLFMNAIVAKKKRGKFTQQQIADAFEIHKSSISRQFSSPPNWTVDKLADIAGALDLELHIEARSRVDGALVTPAYHESTPITAAGWSTAEAEACYPAAWADGYYAPRAASS
jgi:predicted XRE-type DNA-binding protein